METYKLVINWVLVISACVGAVGLWAYILEVIQGRITRYTTWKELNIDQLVLAIMVIAAPIVFVSALIVGAIIKAHS